MQPTYLSYDKGTILIRSDAKVPYSTWDDRVRAFRAQGLYYREILEFLKKSELSTIKDSVEDLPPCPELKCRTVTMRGYQKRSLGAWDKAGRRGVIVLPTGAGKTVIAMKAIELVNQPAVVIVPTLDLLEQWRKRVQEELGIQEVGVYGGGENTVRAVTICTYDSAYIRAGELGNRFSLLIFDEVHHLPGESFRQIAEMFTAPYRVGLTATYEREDMLHLELPRLIGGVVYRLKPEDLAGRYLSDFRLEKVNVELTADEKEEYERNYKAFTHYLEENRIWLNSPIAFQRFIMRSGRDPQARRALLARNRALSIAFNSEAKLDRLEEILHTNPDERVLVFTQHNDLVYKISRRFLLPFITHTTAKEERFDVLKSFREGSYRAIVTSKVLDEGIDVPEASIG
ncbi:MAG: DEAD/DEAH box helicase, partial [Nitrososphaerales archaeon]